MSSGSVVCLVNLVALEVKISLFNSAFSKQLDRLDFNSEILLVHLTDRQGCQLSTKPWSEVLKEVGRAPFGGTLLGDKKKVSHNPYKAAVVCPTATYRGLLNFLGPPYVVVGSTAAIS